MNPITDRRSIRKFLSEPVPEKMIEEIVRAGTLAPSAKNRQPWRFIAVSEGSKEAALSAMERGLEREKRCPFLPDSAEFLSDAENTLGIMRQAPVTIFVVNALGADLRRPLSVDERVYEICNAQSIGAAMENMSLAAQSMGLGSLWIGNVFFAFEELSEFLHTKGVLYAAFSVGFPSEKPDPRPRKAINELFEWRK